MFIHDGLPVIGALDKLGCESDNVLLIIQKFRLLFALSHDLAAYFPQLWPRPRKIGFLKQTGEVF